MVLMPIRRKIYMKKTPFYLEEENNPQNGFSVIADFEGETEDLLKMETGDILPILPLRNMVLFPGVLMPVSVGRRSSARLVRDAQKHNQLIGVVCQKKSDTEYPLLEDLHMVGTVGKIIRILEMPDHTSTVIIQGAQRFNLLEITETEPYMMGRIEQLEDAIPNKNDKEFQALSEAIRDLMSRYIKVSDFMPNDAQFALKNIRNNVFLIEFICENLPLKKDDKMDLLTMNGIKSRAYRLLEILNREVQLAEIKVSIQMRAREDIDQQQR